MERLGKPSLLDLQLIICVLYTLLMLYAWASRLRLVPPMAVSPGLLAANWRRSPRQYFWHHRLQFIGVLGGGEYLTRRALFRRGDVDYRSCELGEPFVRIGLFGECRLK